MGLFEFILIALLIISLSEVATKVLGPVARQLAELLAESVRDKRALREGGRPPALPAEAVEALEERLARIEERLDFIEELRAPEDRRLLR